MPTTFRIREPPEERRLRVVSYTPKEVQDILELIESETELISVYSGLCNKAKNVFSEFGAPIKDFVEHPNEGINALELSRKFSKRAADLRESLEMHNGLLMVAEARNVKDAIARMTFNRIIQMNVKRSREATANYKKLGFLGRMVLRRGESVPKKIKLVAGSLKELRSELAKEMDFFTELERDMDALASEETLTKSLVNVQQACKKRMDLCRQEIRDAEALLLELEKRRHEVAGRN